MKKFALFFSLVSLVSVTAPAQAGIKPFLTCDAAGTEGGLEALTVSTTDRTGRFTLSLTVSGPGGFMETYTYSLREAAHGHGDSESEYVSLTPGRAQLTLNDLSARKLTGRLVAIGPKTAQIYPNARFDYELACKRVN